MNPIETLKYHNKWRRDGEGEMCNPADLGKAIDTVIADYEALQKKNDDLSAKLAEIINAHDCKDTHELWKAVRKTLAQSLADIRAEAVIEAADKVIRHNEHSFCIHCSLIDHANRIKEG